jgi:hypothetical protein
LLTRILHQVCTSSFYFPRASSPSSSPALFSCHAHGIYRMYFVEFALSRYFSCRFHFHFEAKFLFVYVLGEIPACLRGGEWIIRHLDIQDYISNYHPYSNEELMQAIGDSHGALSFQLAADNSSCGTKPKLVRLCPVSTQ